MSEEFEGIYWEGPAAAPIRARVALTPSALAISYRKQDQTLPVTVYWQAYRIAKDAAAGPGKTILRYGGSPGQLLEVPDTRFLPEFDRYYRPAPLRPGSPPAGSGTSLWGIWVVALILLALVPVIYFWAIPVLGDFAGRRLPPDYERLLGRQLQSYMLNQEKADPVRTAWMRGFARQLHLKAPYPIDIAVVANPEPNAFAIPGGYIVVHHGLLEIMESPEELAALLAHEYGHLQLRHATRTLFRHLSGYLFVSILLGDVSGITAIVLENAQSLRSLQYSRELEKEADLLALQILRENKLNPYGMVRLFDHLKEQSKESETEFISSHPLLRSRINYVEALLQKERPVIVPNDSLQYYWKKLKAGTE